MSQLMQGGHTPADMARAKAHNALVIENSRLRQANSDMLEALERISCLIDLADEWTFAGRHEARSLARAAITKAKEAE